MTAWVFGYGSLIWRPGFQYAERVTGFIKGYKRRFWQGSTDHRGVPESPGRVVTLVPSNPDSEDPEDITWGVAYRIEAENYADVKAYLDHREQGGYSIVHMDVYADHGKPIVFGCLVYVGLLDNPNYLGEATMEAIAMQIHRSVGPSGRNVDYLFNLCEAVRTIVPQAIDPHLFGLEQLVLNLIASSP